MRFSKFKYHFLIIIVAINFLISCDDGNVIVSSFNFDENTNLSLCQQNNINVLYFIDPETNEAISFRFPNADFDGTFTGLETTETLEIPISSDNKVVYRKLSSGTNGADYFCQEIPPSSPQVNEEFVSTTGGMAVLEIRISNQDDNDGIPAELEDINGDGNLFNDDSDGDGIPNFIDTDDDNDNVLTASEELEALDDNGNVITDENGDVVYVDTDNDGVPNYLDNDDDGDGVLTKNEDLNACEDPENPALNPDNDLNADGLANYLNPNITDSFEVNVVKRNRITRSFFTQVVFTDITFENLNTGESLSFTNFIMGRFQTSASQDLPFNDSVVSEDEVSNICQ
ncbi:hypothetical protein [Psychroflexus sp. MBR-150]